MPASFWIGGVRPVLMATYWLNFLISGTQPFSYHLVNVLLHAATSVMIFCIYNRVLTISHAPIPQTVDRRWFALFGAALFLLHPLQTESVDYIAGRSELVSGFFFFAGWLVFLRNFDKDTSLGLTLKILAMSGLGILGKESAISLPALFLLTDFYFADGPIAKQLLRRFKLYSVILFGGLAAAIYILRSLSSASAAGFLSGIRPFDYTLTQCRVILIYLRLFFVPVDQNGDWQLPFYHSLTQGGAWIYVLALLVLLALVVWLYKRERLISFGLAAFFLLLAPTSSIVPVNDAIAERRMYLPIAGLILACLGLAAKVRFTPALRRAVAIVAILVCSALSWSRSAAWASDFNLWSESVRANPINSRAHFGLGSAMMSRGDCTGAVREFSTARSQTGTAQGGGYPAEVLWNLAEAYQCGKKPAEALVLYRSFAEVNPTAAAYKQIGFVEAILGHADAAVAAFEQALKLDPNDATAYAYRGLARLAMNNPEGARTDLRHALELEPENRVATDGLARLSAGH
jgi:tetratricopeptide (TPR) repeat protein